MEQTDLLVVLCHRTLALKDVDFYRRLVVHRCGKGFGLLGRNGGIGFNHTGHHAAEGLDTE